MDKHIILHAGIHKTGTTFLQRAMHAHRALLLEHGVDYPDIGIIDGAHHHLGGTLLHDLRLGMFPTAQEPRWSRIEDVPYWQELVTHVRATAAPLVVISTEEFEWLTQPQVVADFLRAQLPDVRVHVLFYLRRQDSYLEAFYQQLVKDFGIRLTASFADWVGEPGFIFFDALAERWENAFGPGSVQLKIFEDERRRDLLAGFLDAVGAPPQLAERMPVDRADPVLASKASIDSRCIEFLRLCNAQPADPERHARILAAAVAASRRIAARDDAPTTVMPAAVRVRILRSVQESNARLRQRYFPLRRALFPADEGPAAQCRTEVNDIVGDLMASGLF